MLLGTGTNNGSQEALVPLSFNTTAGIGAAVGDTFSLTGIGYAGAVYGPYPVFAPGLMYLPCRNNNESPADGAVLAFSVQDTGITKVNGDLQFDINDSNAVSYPAIALAGDGTLYAFADVGGGEYMVRAGAISEGVFAAVGNPLTGDLPNTGGGLAALVIDGHFCVAHSDTNDGINHAELRSFSFDGTDWTAETSLDLAGAYAGWLTLPGCIIGITSARIIEVYTYTAAGGFALAWSLDPTTLSATYDQPEMWLADQATGYLWFGLSDGDYLTGAHYVLEPNFGTGQFDLVASLEDIGQHRLYALALYGDVLFCNDVDYNGTYAHVRSGSTLGDALPGGLGTYDSAVPLPLLEA